MPVIWGARVVGAENQAELGGARVGCVRGRRVGEHRGLVYCVDEVRVFPRKMAPLGSRHAITVPPGSAEKTGDPRVPEFITSPPSRFYSVEHFIKTPKPNRCFHLLGLPVVFGRASFSVLLSNTSLFLGWEGRGERERTFSCACPPCLFGALKRQQLGAQHGPRGRGKGSRA